MRIQLVVSICGDIVSSVCPLLRQWWNETEAWARELTVPPNEISGGFRQKPEGLVSHHGYKVARYRSRFVRQLEQMNVEYLELMRAWPEGGYRTSEWDFFGLYGVDSSAGAIFVVGMDIDRLRNLSDISLRSFSQEAVHRSSRYLNPKYGFAVSMPKLFMAGGYAIGLASGELPEEMIDDCNAWSRFSGKECDRTLRNVYGYNVLNAKHLDIPIDGQRLEDWIKASSGRGRIASSGNGLFLWTFQEDDDQEAFLNWDYPPVVHTRKELKRYEIFPWQEFRRQQQEPLR